MAGEGPVVSSIEALSTPRAPLHLRYFALLESNANFRRLWLAQLISEIGDWFYSLAVYDLLLEVTHSSQAVSWAIIIQLLPFFFMTPLAGPVVDRVSRRRLMIFADIARGFIVLGLLTARTAADVGWVYLLLGLEVIFAALFEPARNALLPNIARADELLPANALSSATWSFALAVGAAIGGAVTALLGRPVAFVLNSLSFFVSAALVNRISARETHTRLSRESESATATPLREGWDYLRRHPKVMALVLVKTGLGFAGGALVLVAVFGERVFPLAGRGALAMGLLYAARGAGAGIGPLVGEYVLRGRERWMWNSVSVNFFITSLAFLALSRAPNLPLAALAIFCATLGSSNNWVVSTTLLQLHVADRFRGRVFALDFGLLTLTASASNYGIGAGLDRWHLTAREMALLLGLVVMVPGALWLAAQAKWGGKD